MCSNASPKYCILGIKNCDRADLHTNRFTTDGRACRVTENDSELIALLYGSPLQFSLSQKVRNWLRKVELFHGAIVFQGAIDYCNIHLFHKHLWPIYFREIYSKADRGQL